MKINHSRDSKITLSFTDGVKHSLATNFITANISLTLFTYVKISRTFLNLHLLVTELSQFSNG